MAPYRPARHCKAHSSRTGQPCRAYAVHGAKVCIAHGGASRQVQRAAARRLIETRMRATVARWMAERQRQLDELEAHGLTPFTWGLERGLASNPGDGNP
jgi:hypothetical protein